MESKLLDFCICEMGWHSVPTIGKQVEFQENETQVMKWSQLYRTELGWFTQFLQFFEFPTLIHGGEASPLPPWITYL